MADETPRPTQADSTGPPPDDSSVTLVGSDLPLGPAGYELDAELGRGGMGVVYKARHRGLGRVCALKMILLGTHASEELRGRFRTEAQAVAQLDHPNVVQIYEIGTHQGQPFMALEFCPGGSLFDRLRAGPLAATEAAELVRALADAMRHAHAAGIVHRDLKPANVLLDERRTPKVTDFGLAKRLDDDTDRTRPGAVVGTPSYMPPEQARGLRAVGPAVDVYALGAILYECLSGRPPFQAASVGETTYQILHDDAVPLRRLNPAVPCDLETIAHKCLEKDPARRYASAAALADDLGRFLAGRPIQARPVGPVERAAKWVRRNLVVTLLAAAVVASLIAGAVVAGVFAYRASVEAQRANENADTARTEAEAARKAEAEAREQERLARFAALRAEHGSHAGQLELLQRALEDRDLVVAERLLGEVPVPFRHTWETRCLAGYLDRKAGRFPMSANGSVIGVAFRPDGKGLIVATQDALQEWDPATGNVRPLGKHGHPPTPLALAFRPDGSLLVSADWGGKVQAWKPAGGAAVWQAPARAGRIQTVAINPAGAFVAVGYQDGAVRLLDAATGQEKWNQPGRGAVVALGFGPAGTLGVVAADGTLRERKPDTGEEAKAQRLEERTVQHAAFSADGKWLAYPTLQGKVQLADRTTAAVRHTLAGHPSMVQGLAFAPDGKTLFTVGVEGSVRAWDVAGGQERGSLQACALPLSGVACGPDGATVAVFPSVGPLRLWYPDAELAAATLRGHRGPVRAVAFSPDGGSLASAGEDAVKVWDVATRRERHSFPRALTFRALAVAFANAGRDVVAVDGMHTVRMWDATTGAAKATPPFDPKGNFRSAAFSPDGALLALTIDKILTREVVVWQIEPWRLCFRVSIKAVRPPVATFGPDGKTLYVLDQETEWLRYDTATGEEVGRGPAPRFVADALAVAPDGRTIAATGIEAPLRMLDPANGAIRQELKGGAPAGGRPTFSPDGSRLAVGSTRTAALWDLVTGREKVTLRGHTQFVAGTAFSQDGKLLATASLDGTVRLWDATAGGERRTFAGPENWVTRVAVSRDGHRVAAGSYDHTVRVWDRATAAEEHVFRGHAAVVEAVAFSPDGTRLASAGWDKAVRVWDLATGRERLVLRGHTFPVYSVAWSPDGRTIASGANDSTIRIWDAESGDHRQTLTGHKGTVHALAFSPRGDILMSIGVDGTARLWDAATGEPRSSVAAHASNGRDVCFSPDGSRFASAGLDRTVKVHAVADAALHHTLEHPHQVWATAWSPDGRRIASGCWDGRGRVWDAASGELLATLAGHAGPVIGVCFGADGQSIYTASHDGSVREWAVPARRGE